MPDHSSVLFQNVAETREILGYEGVRLQRAPESEPASVTLAAPSGRVRVQPFWGPYQGDPFTVGYGEETVEFEVPEKVRDGRARGGRGFDPRVCRLVLRGASGMCGDWLLYQGVEGDVRPPEPDEVPGTRYLAYGTSITEDGSTSEAP